MAEQKSTKNADTVYSTLLEMLDDRHWKYDRVDDQRLVHFTVNGEDIPMEFLIHVDLERDLVIMMSMLPFAFSPEKRVDGAIATSHANYKLADGCFDYEYETGKIMFKLTSSFVGSLISKQLLAYMIDVSCFTIDHYNDKFLLLDRGGLSLEDFMKSF